MSTTIATSKKSSVPPLYPTPLTWLYVAFAIACVVAMVVGFR
jgi:hypothetical protein